MAHFTVGSVPYVNAVPLTHHLEDLGVNVIFDVPSRLPALLQSGQAQAVLVSSVDALRVPNRRMAAGVCIGSDGPVKSVRLFSKVPYSQIKTLAWDASSMTSNRLAEVVLAEVYGTRPRTTVQSPSLDAMLESGDACILIGDIGMMAEPGNLQVLDLGEAWTAMTGLPFVWAGWIGGDDLTADLVHLLQDASRRSELGRGTLPSPDGNAIIQMVDATAGWRPGDVEDYYRNVMVYEMDERMVSGLREFRRLLLVNGFDDCTEFPELVI